MKERDRAIIADLARFRVLTRDQIASLHFANVKNPITAANSTLLRLYRQGLIDRSANYQPYLYFPSDGSIKKDSAKVPHFLTIADAYLELCRHAKPSHFVVEPKYEKGLAEADCFMIIKGSPLFLEVQRSTYSEKVMADKIARYEALYDSGIIQREAWQPVSRKVFPAVLVLTQTRYAVSGSRFPIIQAASIEDFMRSMQVPKPVKDERKPEGVRIKIG
ncbi:replication-relaxation family protein [Peribacillus asahii]|uniref:replication-relaxation family protein n=1 Tax=Peribacillus asahii TaxID=228899 RepID=UPI00207AC7C8|nr:replication-relaxation family protein [Peribacillus asahii]USK70201.1 replication-relaxation family protein [Peribacillus asahii]